jgi:hypothetical protein
MALKGLPRQWSSYSAYLESPQWKSLSMQARTRDDHTCQDCGAPADHVHHVTYPAEWGAETVDFLISLCASCHAARHGKHPPPKITMTIECCSPTGINQTVVVAAEDARSILRTMRSLIEGVDKDTP